MAKPTPKLSANRIRSGVRIGKAAEATKWKFAQLELSSNERPVFEEEGTSNIFGPLIEAVPKAQTEAK